MVELLLKEGDMPGGGGGIYDGLGGIDGVNGEYGCDCDCGMER